MNDAPSPAQRPQGLSPQALLLLHETAADWFMRRSESRWTGADERALQAWLSQSPLHREVFEDLALINHDLHQIPLAHDPSWRAVAPKLAAQSASGTARPRSARGRRAWVSLAVATCAALVLGGYGWQRWDGTASYALEVSTGPRETRTIALPDGSTAALNFGTRLKVRYYPRRREVSMERGEAFFEVAAGAGRPFTVDSGTSQVKVVGTAFNLRASAAQFVVQVLEGRVEVRPDLLAQQGKVLVIGPGGGVAVDHTTGQARSLAFAAATVGRWRSGQLDFQRTPLGEVAQELARYLGQPVMLADEGLARLPVSGVAATAQPQAFLKALPELLPLRVQQLPDGSWRIAGR